MTRHLTACRRKAIGAHYTPEGLADYVADRILAHFDPSACEPLRILDPACGDGALLRSMARALRKGGCQRFELWGVESDHEAADRARQRLDGQGQTRATVLTGDFLDMVTGPLGQGNLYESSSPGASLPEGFDLVIANPPYVRTQVLGAGEVRRLAERFGLSGRVDLHHAFIVGISAAIREGGIAGIILSNRFLSTLSGASVRRCLARDFDILEVIDLGDTKLFDAAVLPAVIIGVRHGAPAARTSAPPAFLRVYARGKAAVGGPTDARACPSIYEALREGRPGAFATRGGVYELSCGQLAVPVDASRVWELVTDVEARWILGIRAAARGTFGDVAKVRVGIKTTADSVFIRSDWDSLPEAMRPEDALLRPILRHDDCRQWALPKGERVGHRVLYPHEVQQGERRAVNLDLYPRAKAYLESHRHRLEGRGYVTDSGRQWFEIWVPQDPDSWAALKVVFPDISDEPRFFHDASGWVVDGNCYWMTLLPGMPEDLLFLLLGVANSRVMSRFHDLTFNNRLYAGRRRYITQYVSKYPCPDPSSPAARRLALRVKELVRIHENEPGATETGAEVDALVCEAFQVEPFRSE